MSTPQQHQARQQPFGYSCRGCGQCCAHKLIQVNPFEIASMARGLAMSTSAFRAAYTERDGSLLQRTFDDVCVFHRDGRCLVHDWRPLVCRLYPLGRYSERDGSERWVQFEPHPQSQGLYTSGGTIAEFIAAQGALAFMQAADDYADWVCAAQAAIDAGAALMAAGDDPLDMDSAIAAYCAGRKCDEPNDLEARRQLHLKILYQAIEGDSNHE